jgi:hypothetical protein
VYPTSARHELLALHAAVKYIQDNIGKKVRKKGDGDVLGKIASPEYEQIVPNIKGTGIRGRYEQFVRIQKINVE